MRPFSFRVAALSQKMESVVWEEVLARAWVAEEEEIVVVALQHSTDDEEEEDFSRKEKIIAHLDYVVAGYRRSGTLRTWVLAKKAFYEERPVSVASDFGSEAVLTVVVTVENFAAAIVNCHFPSAMMASDRSDVIRDALAVVDAPGYFSLVEDDEANFSAEKKICDMHI